MTCSLFHQNYYKISSMIPITHILLVLLLTQALASRSCSDPSCFVKKLFDFNYPGEGIYNITLSGNPSEMNNFIKAYGDLNNDLRSDYVSVDNDNNTIIFIYSTSTNLYELKQNYTVFENCYPINYYLYDINGDGSLDITVWGSSGTGNCMYPLIQTDSTFNVALPDTLNFTASTTQPSLFEFNLEAGGGTVKTNGLLIYDNDVGSRFIQYFETNGYKNITWSSMFVNSTDYTSTQFSNWHWNTFVDLTNDCFPDFVITNQQGEIEFWVYNSTSRTFFLSNLKSQLTATAMLSLNIIDLNYDGGLDLVIAEANQINIYLGTHTLNIDSDFCVDQSYWFDFIWSPRVFSLETDQVLSQQNLQFADLNIDGYPEMMVLVSISGGPISAIIYQNYFSSGNTFGMFEEYTNKARSFINSLSVQTISFFDILDNGIVDILVNVDTSNGVESLALYNNYLYQNYYYIKAYGTNGKTTSKGAQLPGVSFYWLNSVGNQQKVSICAQITQSSYNSYPMPYVLTGLGRANNYVEMFTIGRLGEKASWSPIIPNSQLALFAGSEPSSTWGIKIFIMPADSLVYVIIVCIVILTILGVILAGIKIHRKRTEENVPLLNDI